MISTNFLKVVKRLHVQPAKGIASSVVTRCQSASAEAGKKDLVLVDVNDKTGISVVTLNRQPVNSLNLELLSAFSKVLDDLQNNRCRGMILTSSSKTVFSAGLDIMEMYKPEEKRCREFWSTLQDCWLKLYGSHFPTAAAINGHSPAGGCLLAMCCEYRVMLDNFTIGLNETKLGIVAPAWFMATMKNVIPNRTAEMALTLGTLFQTNEALKIGLIDEIGVDKADAIAKCEVFLSRFNKIPPMARGITKQFFRNKEIEALEDNRNNDIDLFIAAVSSPKVQKSLEVYIEGLKQRK